jgi:hypothetical protein
MLVGLPRLAATEIMDLDQINEAEAKRRAELARPQNAAKPAKVRDEAPKRIDPERLSKAIRYIKDHPQS